MFILLYMYHIYYDSYLIPKYFLFKLKVYRNLQNVCILGGFWLHITLNVTIIFDLI